MLVSNPDDVPCPRGAWLPSLAGTLKGTSCCPQGLCLSQKKVDTFRGRDGGPRPRAGMPSDGGLASCRRRTHAGLVKGLRAEAHGGCTVRETTVGGGQLPQTVSSSRVSFLPGV